jgi:hypothetical protein
MAIRTRKLIVLGAASVAFIAGGVFPAYALASSGPRGLHAQRRPGNERLGTVSAVEGSSITFAARDGATYTVDASSAKIIKQGADASLAAIAVGDPIAVIGPETAGSIEAKAVIEGPKAAAHRGVVIGGTIVSIGNGSFVLQPKGHPDKPARAPMTVTTDSATVVSRQGQSVGLGGLSEGMNIIVSGTRPGPDAILASKVLIRTP